MRTIIVVCYSHPELYPPTLNAINELSEIYDKVFVYGLNTLETNWKYPKNVELILYGKRVSTEQMMRWNPFKKWMYYLKWSLKLKKTVSSHSIKNIVFYDTFPFLALWLNGFLQKKCFFVWYHNHDILERKLLTTFSPSWLSAKIEDKYMNRLSLFSLSSMERMKYFNINPDKVKVCFLPNYPSKKYFAQFQKNKIIEDNIKLIYQGKVDNQHGLEEIIECLPEKINDKNISLTIVGKITQEYKTKLLQKAKMLKVEKNLIIHDFVPYYKLPEITANHHVGIAIYNSAETHVQFKTVTTASNKIYEYAALGLGVLLLDNETFKSKLEQYPWCLFTNLQKNNLIDILTKIANDYIYISSEAKNDFEKKLNYEHYFNKLKQYLP